MMLYGLDAGTAPLFLADMALYIFLAFICRGLKALWGYLRKKGVDTSKVIDNMHDLIVKTIIA